MYATGKLLLRRLKVTHNIICECALFMYIMCMHARMRLCSCEDVRMWCMRVHAYAHIRGCVRACVRLQVCCPLTIRTGCRGPGGLVACS